MVATPAECNDVVNRAVALVDLSCILIDICESPVNRLTANVADPLVALGQDNGVDVLNKVLRLEQTSDRIMARTCLRMSNFPVTLDASGIFELLLRRHLRTPVRMRPDIVIVGCLIPAVRTVSGISVGTGTGMMEVAQWLDGFTTRAFLSRPSLSVYALLFV